MQVWVRLACRGAVLSFAAEDGSLVVQCGGRGSWGTQERAEEPKKARNVGFGI